MFCSNEGHCTRECTADPDCPCGAICAASCGVCIGVDFDAGTMSRATCFTASTEFPELLSACRADLVDLASLAARAQRGRCQFVPPANCRAGGFVGGRFEWVDAAAVSDRAEASSDGGTDATDAATDGGSDASDVSNDTTGG